MPDNIYFVGINKKIYFFNHIDNFIQAVDNIEKFHNLSIFVRSFNKLIKGFKYKKIFNRKLIYKVLTKVYSKDFLEKMNQDCKLIIADVSLTPVLLYYIKHYSCAKIAIYFWNSIGKREQCFLNILDNSRYFTYSFDDSKKYNITYANTFFSNQIKLKKSFFENDIYFLGKNKHRVQELDRFAELMQLNGMTCKFNIVDTKKEEVNYVKYLDKPISYQEYLDNVSMAKSLIEVVSTNNNLTLRVMESIFLNKKLITNNKKIKEYPFYCSNNIFIYDSLDNINIENLKEFMNCEYITIDKTILNEYEYTSFLKRIGDFIDDTKGI